jgi:5S rRNA maturation endonuclease (ribonuclease M5)
MKKEIDIFKTDISLIDFVASLGGEIKKDKSTKNSVVVDFHNTKFVITRNVNGHYIYFDLFNSSSNGTIIDFYKNVVDKNADFKKIMINLRKFYKNGYIQVEKLEISNSVDEVFNYSRITKNIEETDINTISINRNISVDTIKEFKDIILKDNRTNNCFSNFEYYFDENDRFKFNLCGFEIKNSTTGFKQQLGNKGLWGKKLGHSQDIYLFESAYDAIAFREMYQEMGFYISTAGAISQKQIEYLKAIIKSAKSNNIYICLDNDDAGNVLSDNITEQLKTLKINIHRYKSQSKDWNQDLKDKKRM